MILRLERRDLNLEFDLKLKYLQIHCNVLSIRGEGQTDSLVLIRVKKFKMTTASIGILSKV